MDNMAAGWDRPQEDEFALCLLGLPCPYIDLAFPNGPPMYPGSLDLSGLTPAELARWKRTFLRFLQTLTFRDPRRLVLKSPPHTARVPVLLELFPDARFVHIVRDPRVVFPSTVNLRKSMTRGTLLPAPDGEPGWRRRCSSEFRVIYDRLEEARPLFKPGRFHELRYEELVKDPVGEMEKVYAALELDGFEQARPRIEQYLRQTDGYETNKYRLSTEDRREIERRWERRDPTLRVRVNPVHRAHSPRPASACSIRGRTPPPRPAAGSSPGRRGTAASRGTAAGRPARR